MTLCTDLQRRIAIAGAFAVATGLTAPTVFKAATAIAPAAAEPARTTWPELSPRTIVLFRHAEAPGTGDPPNFKLGDCSTQRNLNEPGRSQARRIGEAFRARGIEVGKVISSEWCRCAETAELAFPGRVEKVAAFNSFFENRSREPAQTAEARKLLSAWIGPGVLVVVTHQVNITALTGGVPASGEGIIVRVDGSKVVNVGRIKP